MFATSRAKLLGATAVIAVTLVVGGWTFPPRQGSEGVVGVDAWTMPTVSAGVETFTVDMVAQTYAEIDYGSYCYGTVGTYGGDAPFTYLWSGVFWNASTRNVEGYAWNSGWQLVEVWDCHSEYASDQLYFNVTMDGDPCTP